MKTQYKTTKKDCENNIFGVCEGCGRKLTAIETVDNSGNPTFWQGCEYCSRFRSGIEPIYFKVARNVVENDILVPYLFMNKFDYTDSPKKLDYYYDRQTAGLSYKIKQIHNLIKEYETKSPNK